MSEPPIRMDEWLSELTRLSAESTDAGGFTTTEIADRLGRCHLWVRRAIRRALDAGAWEMAGRKRGTAIDGRPTYSPVYRPVQGDPKDGKRSRK